jgi:uncharacterized protein (UPF0332 family)
LTLHHDLLEQAAHLARRETRKPKQASLRRAVSAAYYALFHLLTSDAARLLSPVTPPNLKIVVQRAFNHADMNKVCKSFVAAHVASEANKRSDAIPSATRQLLTFPLDSDLVDVLQAFVKLQDARHEADYDLQRSWSRLDAMAYVEVARQAFAKWARVRRAPNAAVFMSALLLQRYWVR